MQARGIRFVAALMGTFVVLVGIFFGLLSISPLGRVTLDIELTSSSSGFSQIFVPDADGQLSEKRSTWQVVRPGYNVLNFPITSLGGTVGEQIRWDPLDTPTEMTVESIQLKSILSSIEFDPMLITPSVGMSAVIEDGAGASFAAESNDAQALLPIDSREFHSQSVIQILLISVLSSLIATLTLGFFLKRSMRDPRKSSFRETRAWTVGVPFWVVVPITVMLVTLLGVLFAGSQTIGISWDEQAYVDSMQEFFRSGWFAPRSLFVAGSLTAADALVHGVTGPLAAHLLSAVIGVEFFSEPSSSVAAFEARHLGVAVLTALGLAATYAIGRVVFGSWRWGLVSVTTVAAIPLWLGHGMFNIQDIPVGVGYTVFTLGLVFISGKQTGNIWRSLSVFLLLLMGAVLAVGTRPGIWIALALSSVFSLTIWSILSTQVQDKSSRISELLTRSLTILVSGVSAYLILWALNPTVYSDPIGLFVGAVRTSSNFPVELTTLTAGMPLSADPPWFYFPLWFGAQIPIVILLLFLIGALTVVVSCIQSAVGKTPLATHCADLVPVTLQAIAIPIAAIVLGTTLYGGIRQLLFILPAVGVLAVAGLWSVLSAVKSERMSWFKVPIWIGFLLGIAVPTMAQLQLFPYSFAYFNAAAATKDIDGAWEVDGWWLSGREALESSPGATQIFCADSDLRPIVNCERIPSINPFVAERTVSQAGNSDSDSTPADEYLLISRAGTLSTDSNCSEIASVNRPLLWGKVTLSQISRCTLKPALLPAEGAAFAGGEAHDPALAWGWDPFLAWGWRTDESGTWSTGRRSAVAFALPDSPEGLPSSIEVVGLTPEEAGVPVIVDVLVNGAPAGTIEFPLSQDSTTIEIGLPEELAMGGVDGRVVVEFLRTPSTSTGESILSDTTGFRLDSLAVR